MLITSLLLSLAAAPEANPQLPIFSCTITEHTLEANNLSHGTLVVSFASSDRAAVLHLALPAHGGHQAAALATLQDLREDSVALGVALKGHGGRAASPVQ